MIKRLLLLIALMAIVGFPQSALRAAPPPLNLEDLVGNWRNVQNPKQTFTFKKDGGDYVLVTNRTKTYTDWKKVIAENDRLNYERDATGEDVRSAKRVKGSDPLPDAIVSAAASSGRVKEAFIARAKRSDKWFADKCDLQMDVRWRGFDIDWKSDRPDTWSNVDKYASETFEQIHYKWPNLAKSTVETTTTASDSISELDRQTLATEVNGYFEERPAMEVYGQFGSALFKPMYKAVTGVNPAETFLGKIAEKLIETGISKSLEGNLQVSDLGAAIAGQVLDKALDSVSDREPYASIKAKIDKELSRVDKELADYATGQLGEKAIDSGADLLTPKETKALQDYLDEQCRYEIVRLKPHGKIGGGMAIVDRQMGTATVSLVVLPSGSRTLGHIASGDTTVGEANAQGSHIHMQIGFHIAN